MIPGTSIPNRTVRIRRFHLGAALRVAGVVLLAAGLWSPVSRGVISRQGTPETVLAAKIRPAGVTTLAAMAPGRVEFLRVQPGSLVDEGQLVASLSSELLDAEWEQAQRRVQSVNARLRLLNDPVRESVQRELRSNRYRLSLMNWQMAQSRLNEFSGLDAEQDYRQASERLSQVTQLAAKRLATEDELNDARKAVEAARRTLRARQDAVARLKEEATAAQMQLGSAQLELQESGRNLAPATLELQDALSALAQIERQREGLRSVAPRRGTVTRVHVHEGDEVIAGTPLVEIADLSRLHIEAPVTAKLAQAIKPGDAVRVRIPTEVVHEETATVSDVLLAPDPNQESYLIRVVIPNPDPSTILVGLEGSIIIEQGMTKWPKRVF